MLLPRRARSDKLLSHNNLSYAFNDKTYKLMTHKLTEDYKKNLKIYESCLSKTEGLIRELISQHGINFHKIEARIKDPIRLNEKIYRKEEKYKSLLEITDLIGIRVITYFEDEVDKIASIIESEFLIDKENSIDKRKIEADRFGYKSLHFVAALNEQRKELTEYKRFRDIKIEIQIRSILQHAWAEIEHDIGYKGEHAIPDAFKRNFYRVAALLEMADIEFVKIKDGLKQYEKTIGDVIKKHPEDVEINAASLNSFILTNSTYLELTKQMDKFMKLDIDILPRHIQQDVSRLHFLKITTIKQLEKIIVGNQEQIIKFAIEWVGNTKGKRFTKAVPIFYLCYLLVGEKRDIELANNYFSKFIGSSPHFPNYGQKIIDVYNKITS